MDTHRPEGYVAILRHKLFGRNELHRFEGLLTSPGPVADTIDSLARGCVYVADETTRRNPAYKQVVVHAVLMRDAPAGAEALVRPPGVLDTVATDASIGFGAPLRDTFCASQIETTLLAGVRGILAREGIGGRVHGVHVHGLINDEDDPVRQFYLGVVVSAHIWAPGALDARRHRWTSLDAARREPLDPWSRAIIEKVPHL